MTIPGGFILQPRCIDDSDIMREPPVVRELWHYLLRRVNHKDTGKYERGSAFFNLGDIQEALHWYVGYRKQKYSKPQLTKSLRRLRERNMIATAKATRGVYVTILNYHYYQAPESYERNDEDHAKETRRKQSGRTKNKNEKNVRKEEEKSTYLSSQISRNGKIPVKQIIDDWNLSVSCNESPMPEVTKIATGTTRYRHVRARWKEHPDIETWQKVFTNTTASDFLNGRIKNWAANFDWIIKSADNFIKVLEGNYDNPGERNGKGCLF